jgi:hypothetical protein
MVLQHTAQVLVAKLTYDGTSGAAAEALRFEALHGLWELCSCHPAAVSLTVKVRFSLIWASLLSICCPVRDTALQLTAQILVAQLKCDDSSGAADELRRSEALCSCCPTNVSVTVKVRYSLPCGSNSCCTMESSNICCVANLVKGQLWLLKDHLVCVRCHPNAVLCAGRQGAHRKESSCARNLADESLTHSVCLAGRASRDAHSVPASLQNTIVIKGVTTSPRLL